MEISRLFSQHRMTYVACQQNTQENKTHQQLLSNYSFQME